MGKLVYSDLPAIFTVDDIEDFVRSQQQVTLFVYDLASQSTQVIATSVAEGFHPRWLDDSTIEYSDPDGNDRIVYTMPSLGNLAYVKGGDIWVKALPDGEPQRLTTDARNGVPRWSPSGEWLAFRKGEYEQVWVMRADGGDARSLMATPKGAFAWSPLADRLAYAANDELQVVDADGSNPVTVVARCYGGPPTPPPQEEGRIGRIAWSPDGSWIAYEWRLQQPKQPLSYQGLWKVAVEGGEPIELYASGAPEKGEAILAGWSPDGQRLFYWQGEVLSASMLADGVALYSLPVGGGQPIRLTETVLVHDDFLAPALQGERLAVTAGGYRATWTHKRVAVVEAEGGELTWLTDESVAAFSPAWSPDGIHLAYTAMADRGDLVGGEDARLGMMERRIWVADAQGEPEPRQLTNDTAYRDERPLWSAHGSHILFARMEAEGRASMWLIPAVGGEPRQVVDELTPLPGPAVGWFGYYGYIDWDQLFDWWRGSAEGTERIIVRPGPAPKATLVATPTSTTLPITTTTLSPTSTLTPTLDPTVATAFPLEVGATWRYQAHIEEELGGKLQVRDETITQRVISQTQQANDMIFTLERTGGLNPGRFYYLVRGNTVYLQVNESTSPHYVFPLHVGASWGSVSVVPRAGHCYEWYVEGQEDVDMPAGHFAGCYRQIFYTNPDDTTLWFCPGVGLARLRYRHHGSVHNEDWELTSYPGMATTPTPISLPDTLQAVLWVLAVQFRVNPAEIGLVHWEAMEWPDVCLGVPLRDPCAETITPGYRIILEINGRQYEYRSNLEGSYFLPAAGLQAQIEAATLTWEGDGPDGCQSLALAADGRASIGPCGAPQTPLHLHLFDGMQRPQQLAYLSARFAPLCAETPAGQATFQGEGKEIATPAWQRAIAAWARLVRQELQFGRSGASWGLALGWHGEEDPAGFCDHLQVEGYGLAFASTSRCGGGEAQTFGQTWLDTAELEQLYAWQDRLACFELPERLVFTGTGPQAATEAEVQAILEWAERLWKRIVADRPKLSDVTTMGCPHIPLGGFYDVWQNERVRPRLGCAVAPALAVSGTEAYLCGGDHSLWLQEQGLFVVVNGHHWVFVPDESGLPADTPLMMEPAPRPSPCIQASGRHGWLATHLAEPGAYRGLARGGETTFKGALQQFEGGWLLWNGNVCFVLFGDGTWTMF